MHLYRWLSCKAGKSSLGQESRARGWSMQMQQKRQVVTLASRRLHTTECACAAVEIRLHLCQADKPQPDAASVKHPTKPFSRASTIAMLARLQG
eukprot:scaffold77467_cov20-Tisochrysis_lutea.AAC.1